MNQIDVFNVRLPKEAVKWIDSLVKKGVYGSRSEAVREFLREHFEGLDK